MFAAAYHPATRQALHLSLPAISASADSGEPEDVSLVQIPEFASVLDPEERKQMFFDFLQPYVDAQNEKVHRQRERLLALMERVRQGKALARRDREFILDLGREYDIDEGNHADMEFLQRLLRRVDVLPPSLVLAQAAKESGWGSSRFAKEAYNFFGQWCYVKGCGIVPNRRRSSANHEVKAFSSIEEAVHAYFMNLNTFPSYLDLRLIREELRENSRVIDGISLSEGLVSYSERGDVYVRELQSLIRYNDLLELDADLSSQVVQD
jgi:Bax protein